MEISENYSKASSYFATNGKVNWLYDDGRPAYDKLNNYLLPGLLVIEMHLQVANRHSNNEFS